MTTIDSMTREDAVERMTALHERMEQVAGKHRMSRADELEFAEGRDEFDKLAAHVDKLDRAATIAGAVGGGAGNLRVERGMNPYATTRSDRPYSGQRDAAMRQLERSVKRGLPARAAETVERLTETGPEVERSWAARWVTHTGSDDYRSAFAKLVAYGEARRFGMDCGRTGSL